MSYAAFLAIFCFVPIVGVVILLRRHLRDWKLYALTVALVLIALAYMAPWDHLAAIWGLWTWAPLQTWGRKLWAIPLEEYLFCILQTILAVTVMYALLVWRRSKLAAQTGQQDPE